MNTQKVEYLNIKDLILWTENPRDPISDSVTDQEIADFALNGHSAKWNLRKLAKEMGTHYDFSEIPTVVFHGDKPVVYDGNRRIILGKIKHGLISIYDEDSFVLPSFPEKIPCNVCTKDIALQNVLRKHGDSGSWSPLERDIFLNKHMNRSKSTFLVMEDSTGLISSNPHLNKRFVKEEIFKEEALRRLGFDISNGFLVSKHTDEESRAILSDLMKKIKSGTISTRNNRGKVYEVLDPASRETIDLNIGRKLKKAKYNFETESDSGKKANGDKKPKQSRRTRKNQHALFGGKLYLKMGTVCDVYRDIRDLHKFYLDNRDKLSSSFPSLIRMSLRLLCETAANDLDLEIKSYLHKYFKKAKQTLSQDTKTTLSTQNVSKESLTQLLQVGAHNYEAAENIEQTIAISIILGAMLTTTHGQEATQ